MLLKGQAGLGDTSMYLSQTLSSVIRFLKSLVRGDIPIDPSVDLNAIARMKCCQDLSGADLKTLVKEAGFAAFI